MSRYQSCEGLRLLSQLQDITYPPKLPGRKAPRPVIRYWKKGWGRVTADEAHTEVNMTAKTIHLFTTFGAEV